MNANGSCFSNPDTRFSSVLFTLYVDSCPILLGQVEKLEIWQNWQKGRVSLPLLFMYYLSRNFHGGIIQEKERKITEERERRKQLSKKWKAESEKARENGTPIPKRPLKKEFCRLCDSATALVFDRPLDYQGGNSIDFLPKNLLLNPLEIC